MKMQLDTLDQAEKQLSEDQEQFLIDKREFEEQCKKASYRRGNASVSRSPSSSSARRGRREDRVEENFLKMMPK